MADDRHEAYRSIYTIRELRELFQQTEAEHSVESITYILLTLQRENPKKNISSIIEMTKEELYGKG